MEVRNTSCRCDGSGKRHATLENEHIHSFQGWREQCVLVIERKKEYDEHTIYTRPPSPILRDMEAVVCANTSRCLKREVEGLSWAKSGGEGGENPSLSRSDISVLVDKKRIKLISVPHTLVFCHSF